MRTAIIYKIVIARYHMHLKKIELFHVKKLIFMGRILSIFLPSIVTVSAGRDQEARFPFDTSLIP